MRRPQLLASVTAALLGVVGLPAVTVSAAPVASAVSAATAAPDDLLISEYVEGTSTNKAVELYNPTAAPIDLAGYKLVPYFNGSTTSTVTLTLTGTVAPGDVFVFGSTAAGGPLGALLDQVTTASLWNGDDAIVLTRTDGTVVDSFGQVGVDPGAEWGTGLVSTQDNSLRRKADVCTPDRTPTDLFDPAVEWDGYATDTFDGLGAHTSTCGVTPPTAPVINEFSASTTGTDVEYLEVYGAPATDYSTLSILQVEGDLTATAPGIVGSVVSVHPVGTTDANGRWLGSLAANTVQNGSLTLLLVDGFTGAVGTVLDADANGTLDDPAPWTSLLDSVAVNDGGAGDLSYSAAVLGTTHDTTSAFAPGGASRIPDGTDTDTAADWVRNDFDLAGIPGFTGTLVAGEAVNTPGAANTTTLPPPPPPTCDDPATGISAVQGSGAASPLVGQSVQIEGVVVGDFQTGGFQGYYLQDDGDADPATSDGVFVFAPGGLDVAVGDIVHVAGVVSEFFGMTEVTASAAVLCSTGAALPAPVEVTLPLASPTALEPYEGMRATLPQDLALLEFFDFDRFGEIVLGSARQYQPTAVYQPGSPEAVALAAANALDRITLDDGRSTQNPDPARHPNGDPFTLDNRFRGGDLVTGATGVIDWRFDTWRLQPTAGAAYTSTNPRTAPPAVGGSLKVASFNVLNYFTTLNSRGANTAEELVRQQAKIVAAISALDADIVGLMEIENNGTAVATLVDALNAATAPGTYAYVDTGIVGTDEIFQAVIYRPATVSPKGAPAYLTSAVDSRFLDDKNRPALAQTFTETATGADLTVVVNHLKSKGSACDDVGDPIDPNGQGNCNGVRTAAAEALVDWLATDPTHSGSAKALVIGDLNSYDKEDPVRAIVAGGYTDLVAKYGGEYAYSYLFDGQLGYLDHALASPGLTGQVTGTAHWHANADEADLIDYDMTFKLPAQAAIYAPDAYRASDHDAVLVGLSLTPPDTTPPTITVTASPARIWPANGKLIRVRTTVTAADDGGPVTVTFNGISTNRPARDYVVLSDTSFRLRAAKWARYTLTYTATDAAGNSTTTSVTVRVARR